MYKILYLEDDKNLSDTIAEYLQDNNFEVNRVYRSSDALDMLYNKNFDLLLFDINLPDISGFELLKNLRDAKINTPTIFTTTLHKLDDLNMAYELGADDYLKKPFELKELLCRINALTKRCYNAKSDIVKISKDIDFDIKNQILYKNHNIIKLNYKELQLLKLLVKHKNQIVLFDTIYTEVWTANQENSEASLRTYIKNLRKVLGKEKIQSFKKQGYKLVF